MKQFKQSKHQPKRKSKDKTKEEGWNNRFYLEKIPYYESSHDKASLINQPLYKSSHEERPGIQYDRTSYQSQGQSKYQPMSYPPIHQHENIREKDRDKEEAFLEDLSLIQNLWDDLGVLEQYKETFEAMARQLNEKARKEFLDYENQSLKRLRENLNKLSKETINREKAVKALQQYDECLSKEPFLSSKKLNDDVLQEIMKTVKSLRIHSVNIVNHMSKIREISAYNIMNGKYDLDKANKSYNYNKTYFLKMMSDLDFLKHSSLTAYFNFSAESDPFLMHLAEESSNSNYISVNEDMLTAIKQSEYLMKQDMIFYHIQSTNKTEQTYPLYNRKSQGSESSKASFRNYSSTKRQTGVSPKIYNSPNMSQFLHQLRSGPNYDQLFLYKNKLGVNESSDGSIKKPAKVKIKIDREEIHSMTRAELVQKIEEFEKLKMDEQRKLEKKESEKAERLESAKRRKNEEDEKERERLKRIKEKEQEKAIEIERKKERLKKEAEEKRKEEEAQKELKDDSNEREPEIKEESISSEDNDELKEQREKEKREEEERLRKEIEEKEEEEQLQREIEEKEEEERLQRKKEEKEEQERLIKEQEAKEEQEEKEREAKEEQERLRKEKEEQEQKEQEAKEEQERLIKEQEEKEREAKEKQERLRKEKEEQEQKEREAKEEQERFEKEKELNSFHIVNYFNQPLSYINQFYSSYYSNLPETQRITFKTQPNTNNFTQGLNPKIIVAYNNPEQTSIIGLCQVAYESFSSRTLKLQINHISTVSPNWKAIFTSMITFIKTQLIYDEITLVLYYKYENEEFIINKEVMTLFKETLDFKWLKIENLTHHERNQLISFENTNEHNQRAQNQSLISLNSLTLMTLTSEAFTPKMPFDKFVNVFNANYLVNLLKTQGYILSSTNQIKDQLTEWNIGAIKTDLAGIFTVGFGSLDELSNDYFSLDNISLKDKEKVYNCSVHYLPKLNSNISTISEGYIYNRIQGNIGILQDSITKQRFYLIPSEDNENSLFICELTPQLKDKFLNNSQNIFELFYSYYINLEHNSEDKTLSSALWIPSFSINSHLISDRLAYLDDITIETEDKKEMFLKSIDEYLHVTYDYDRNMMNGFGVDVNENDIIIRNNFLFGLVNVNVLSKMAIPSTSFFLVTKDHWIKA